MLKPCFVRYSEPINNATELDMRLSDFTKRAIERKLEKLEADAKAWAAEQNAKYPNGTPSTHWPYLCGVLTSQIQLMASDVHHHYSHPAAGPGQIIYTWHTDCYEPIECHLDYQRAEKQTEEYPGCDAEMTLTAAYLRGVDIFYLLSQDQIDEIEEQAHLSTED